jgi:hypothetical protein
MENIKGVLTIQKMLSTTLYPALAEHHKEN